MTATLVTDAGRTPGARWVARADAVDRRVLQLAVAPVLDVGCGPGRHTIALAEAGVVVLGIDITPRAVALARTRGAAVLQRSVFDGVPARGRWASALLLDGNIGIGGDPVALLTRIRSLIEHRGRVIVELGREPCATRPRIAHLAIDEAVGPEFPWTEVRHAEIDRVAAAAELRVTRRWRDETRSFVVLEGS
jgi:SAM-dependent methyltransferase